MQGATIKISKCSWGCC